MAKSKKKSTKKPLEVKKHKHSALVVMTINMSKIREEFLKPNKKGDLTLSISLHHSPSPYNDFFIHQVFSNGTEEDSKEASIIGNGLKTVYYEDLIPDLDELGFFEDTDTNVRAV